VAHSSHVSLSRLAPLALVLAAALLVGGVLPAAPASAGAEPVAHTAKKKCKKKAKSSGAVSSKKKKCKKKRGSPAPTASPPVAVPSVPPVGDGGGGDDGGGGGDPATTEELIDAAIASGEISAETGLTYKVFAAFLDPRLPAKYQGASDPLGHAPLDEVIAQWSTLSPAAQATLGPFLIPPYHNGSYWQSKIDGASSSLSPASRASPSPRADPNSPWCTGSLEIVFEDWSFVEATSGIGAGKVRIWYQDRYASTDAALASSLMSAMESKIWPALATLMGREPLPDGGSTGSCAGGSDAVDIALVDASTATTFSHTSAQESTPARTLFPRELSATGWAGLVPYLAHELMHMIQYSYAFSSGSMTSNENQWLREGTAQWVQDYVTDPSYGIGLTPTQTEHQPLPIFFDNPELSLDSTTPAHHDYASYVFPFWAARSGGNPQIVRDFWNAIGTNTSLGAAKAAFGSGWDQAWKDFARTNWNQGSIKDYQTWDAITNTPKLAAQGNLVKDQTSNFNATVAPVAAKYFRFGVPEGTLQLVYNNTGTLSDEAGIQAIIKKQDGTETIEDWSTDASRSLDACNIDEVVLVLSNAAITQGSDANFAFDWTPNSVIRADVCTFPNRWDVSMTGDGNNASFGDETNTFHYEVDFAVKLSSQGGGVATYDQLEDGSTFTWTNSGTIGDCTVEEDANGTVQTGSVRLAAGDPGQYNLYLKTNWADTYNGMEHCPPPDGSFPLTGGFPPFELNFTRSWDGEFTTIMGSNVFDDSDGSDGRTSHMEWTWTLTPSS
jgi:hypothetical protein